MMSPALSTYPAEGQLVAVAGEEIICPRCGAVDGVFTAPAYGCDGKSWPITWRSDRGTPRDATCEDCGALTLIACDSPDRETVRELAARAAACVALHVRSGSWTGWRSIGAE